MQEAESWDVESVRALMGNGNLYVVTMAASVSVASNPETEVNDIGLNLLK